MRLERALLILMLVWISLAPAAAQYRRKYLLPAPGVPAFQGEHNHEILTEANVPEEVIKDLQQRRILLSRRSIAGAYD